MIAKEKIIQILEGYVVEGYRRERVIDEISIDEIADEIVKNCSMPSVVGQSEQLPCGDLIKHNFSLSKIGRCITCDRENKKAR